MMNIKVCKHLFILPGLIKQTRCSYAKGRYLIPANHTRKDTRPNIYKSLKERIQEDDYTQYNPELYKPVNIGFPIKEKATKLKRGAKKTNTNLEKEARKRTLTLDLESVEDSWINSDIGQKQICNVAAHFNIFKDLFGPFAYFYPSTILNVAYDYDEETVTPVYYGNSIKPLEAANPPTVVFKSDPDDIWTLMLVSPDNNIIEENTDFIHWFIGNIRGNDLATGETLFEYMRPFPPKGSGHHRYVFLLYKQTHKVDFSSMKPGGTSVDLDQRNFSTYSFSKENEDTFTPSGICFFQSDYDESTKEFFHNTLEMKEPIYEYQFPERYLSPQEKHPKKRAFNFYLDLHREEEDIAKEVLLERLKKIHPFKREEVPEYPGFVEHEKGMIVWERTDKHYKQLGFGKYRDMYRGRLRPEILPADYM